jgi:putative RNA 2'-phosphotransferase
MQNPSLVERITRSLAYMLRHQPEQFDLELDEYGYADLDDVVAALNERLGEPVEAEDVVGAIEGGDRPRYEIREGRIRALYGHSIQVKPGEPGKPPAVLYVGISRADAERARRYGLRPGRRSYLHLALTAEDALETGRRASRDYAVVTVNALDAWEEGINFYDRKSLFLSDPIPTHFLQVGDVQTDGYGEEGEGDRGGRPRRDEGPPREHRHEPARYEEARRGPPRREPARHEAPRHEAPPREEIPRRALAESWGREEAPAEREPAHAQQQPQVRDRGDRGEHGPARQPPRGGRDRHGRDEPRGERRPDARGPDAPSHGRGDRPPGRRDHGDRSDPSGRPDHAGRREPRAPAPPPFRERAPEPAPTRSAPARETSVSSSDAFGLGVFEAPKRKEEAPAKREAEPRPRETPPPERSPEPARRESDESSFGAGI